MELFLWLIAIQAVIVGSLFILRRASRIRMNQPTKSKPSKS